MKLPHEGVYSASTVPVGAEANAASDRLAFIARRDIAEGEELTLDYAGFSDED